jgi:peptide/nickel transport system permease protein
MSTAGTPGVSDADEGRGPERWALWRQASPTHFVSVSDSASRQVGPVRQIGRRFVLQSAPMIAATALLVLIVAAVAAPVLATHDPNVTDFASSLAGPSSAHWLGTDELGRDTYSRLLYGGRVSLLAAAQALLVALAVGLPLGLLAGYFRGKVDAIISALNDSVMALPGLLLAIAIIGAIGPGLTNAMLAIGLLFAPGFVRLMRGSVISIRENVYIEAAVASGTSAPRVMLRHVLPNSLPPLLVQAAFTIGFAMIAEAGLSFLGFGVRPPDASWGSMLNAAYESIHRSSFQALPPGIAISVAVLAFNVMGDGLRASIGRDTA